MKPGLMSKVVKNYLSTKKWDLTPIPKKDRFFASTNILTFKLILIHRIQDSIKKVFKLNQLANRLSILDKIITSDDLESFYQSMSNKGLSLELKKPITDRSY
jgi:hypothetical protein